MRESISLRTHTTRKTYKNEDEENNERRRVREKENCPSEIYLHRWRSEQMFHSKNELNIYNSFPIDSSVQKQIYVHFLNFSQIFEEKCSRTFSSVK